jgi:ATP-binding cassette subfamily C (CFTR/MRP) protein 4
MIFTASGGVILLTTVDLVFFLELLVVFVLANVFKHFSQPAGRNLERLHVACKIFSISLVPLSQAIAARSPTLGHLNSTLEGLSTIRASRAENIVSREFDNHLDLFASALYMVCANFIAISFGLELLGTIFISVVFVQFLVTGLGRSLPEQFLSIDNTILRYQRRRCRSCDYAVAGHSQHYHQWDNKRGRL